MVLHVLHFSAWPRCRKGTRRISVKRQFVGYGTGTLVYFGRSHIFRSTTNAERHQSLCAQLRTAKALDLSIGRGLLLRADADISSCPLMILAV